MNKKEYLMKELERLRKQQGESTSRSCWTRTSPLVTLGREDESPTGQWRRLVLSTCLLCFQASS